MPKSKPISLHPLSFEQAIDALLKAPAKPPKKQVKSKTVTSHHR
jgi:hypothetical protein